MLASVRGRPGLSPFLTLCLYRHQTFNPSLLPGSGTSTSLRGLFFCSSWWMVCSFMFRSSCCAPARVVTLWIGPLRGCPVCVPTSHLPHTALLTAQKGGPAGPSDCSGVVPSAPAVVSTGPAVALEVRERGEQWLVTFCCPLTPYQTRRLQNPPDCKDSFLPASSWRTGASFFSCCRRKWRYCNKAPTPVSKASKRRRRRM